MTKRALICSGGGLKAAFEAGVLQVWLDELDGVDFQVATSTCSGIFNLAMWCDGRNGEGIANAWRRSNPLSWFALNRHPSRGFGSLERFRKNVLRPVWAINWPQVNRTALDASFDVYNFTQRSVEHIAAADMTEELLLAGASLPFWFPPRVIAGDVCIDAVYATDADLEAAIWKDADELWIIWFMGDLGKWRSNFASEFYATVESASDARIREVIHRVEESNKRERGKGEFPDRIKLKVLRADVPIHYVFSFSKDTLNEAVELGVLRAREWCRQQGYTLKPPRQRPPEPTKLRFTETLTGYVTPGVANPVVGARRGFAKRTRLRAKLTVEIDDVRWFLADPRHQAKVTGTIVSSAFGPPRKLRGGTGVLRQFVYGDDPSFRKMYYSLRFDDGHGASIVFEGEKLVPREEKFHPWRDTTTLYTWLRDGRTRDNIAAGILRLTPPRFARELTTFRASGPRRFDGLRFVARFFLFFWSACARTYAKGWPIVPSTPTGPRARDPSQP